MLGNQRFTTITAWAFVLVSLAVVAGGCGDGEEKATAKRAGATTVLGVTGDAGGSANTGGRDNTESERIVARKLREAKRRLRHAEQVAERNKKKYPVKQLRSLKIVGPLLEPGTDVTMRRLIGDTVRVRIRPKTDDVFEVPGYGIVEPVKGGEINFINFDALRTGKWPFTLQKSGDKMGTLIITER